ncbi:MAG: sugar phosphate isomerase/epimerase and 4-hydroxyphenylpyruvate domain-containing protein [Acetobacteraceae bacterium]|nr:sugar phosphate isomerase/epimerase and 4-hydroxyphenylpyruvate domain-containing protein [Acetobacteraceae bacterium]
MASEFRRLPKSIATVSLSGTLTEKLEAAAAVGFDGVEIFENDLLNFDGSPGDVRRICDGLGLRIDIYQPFRDFEAMPDPQRQRNIDRAERKFDVMGALGTDLVLTCSNCLPGAIDDDGRAADDLALMAERAAKRGLRVGYEALAWGRHVNTWRHAWSIVEKAGHPALGLIVDSFHTLSLRDDPSGLADLPGDRIFYVQLADAPLKTMDVLSWSRHFRNFPGQGDLDVQGFVRAVLASGYGGPLSLEIFNDDFRAAPARITARDGLRSLIFVESLAQDGAGLPPPATVDGVEFLEFAVDETAAEELAGFLRTLGFHHAGRHKSKSVNLYRQGGINLVLNSEQDSAASEHFQLHGPSVCATAFRVDSAARALARGQALLCPEWQERIGEGERRVPAVRAPDGTLVYLVEPDPSGRAIWEDDFDLTDEGRDGAGLESIDHIVQALPAGRMDTYILFWRGVFGLEPQQNWETADPYGLVKSRAMVSADGRVRLALNISESRETATGRFVSAFAGAGVHHIAFATADAALTLERMEQLGAPILRIPENYYDDLAARWGLDDPTLARLQADNLLFDRADGGEFRHAYTDAFEERFFFEAVERRGGYPGFGAVNAAIRAAAQVRLHAINPAML